MNICIPENLRTASKLDFIKGLRDEYGTVSDEFTARLNLAFCVNTWRLLQTEPDRVEFPVTESDISVVPHTLQARLDRLAESLSGHLVSEDGWASFGRACRAEIVLEQNRLARQVVQNMPSDS